MGTAVSFQVIAGECSQAEVHEAVGRAVRGLHRADALFSTWKPDSEVSRLRDGLLDEGELSPEVLEVIDLCWEARRLSDGWFDPWAMPGGFDPTGAVKGWAVDRALEELRAAGVAGAFVNGGGDVALFGEAPGGGPWKVGIQHPWRRDALACVLQVERAVATSGGYERGDHLVDPRRQGPPMAASATVTGTDLAMADALATALAVGGEPVFRRVAEIEGFAAYWIRADGTEFSTDGIVFA